jgi:hypothetical protein
MGSGLIDIAAQILYLRMIFSENRFTLFQITLYSVVSLPLPGT